MKRLNTLPLIALTASLVALSACSSDDNDETIAPEVEPSQADAPEVEPSQADVFEFRTESPDAYTRVDRMGMPAIATALIASKDGYNSANPVDDIAGNFVPEIINSLDFLHGALDGQLVGLGLTPCTVESGTGSCVAFAAPLIIPDTIKIDTNASSGFPNGRDLSAPVIDVTLAVALLELTGDSPPHAATDLVGVLNPAANDKEFSSEFPFLASPH